MSYLLERSKIFGGIHLNCIYVNIFLFLLRDHWDSLTSELLVEEYLNTGKLENYINFTPNPSVTKDTIETTALRGFDGKLYTVEELCSGAWAD